MFEVTATIVLESPLPLTATDKESPKRPWFLYALSLGVCVCVCVPDSAQNHRDISLLHGKRKEATKEEREGT